MGSSQSQGTGFFVQADSEKSKASNSTITQKSGHFAAEQFEKNTHESGQIQKSTFSQAQNSEVEEIHSQKLHQTNI